MFADGNFIQTAFAICIFYYKYQEDIYYGS